MSTVERVADMLGRVPEPNRKPAGAGVVNTHATTHAELIERAVSVKGPRPDPQVKSRIADAGEFSKGLAGVSLDPTKTSRSVKLDLAKLREQNILTPDTARSAVGEGFRRIKRQILANLANPGADISTNLLMVTSPLPGEGKTFCTINLAISLAMEMDRTVLLVDADVAKPSVLRVLGLDPQPGLMDVLLDRNIDLADMMFKTNIDGLTVLPAGLRHAHATELLASEALRALLQEMAERYRDRIIVFDSPPLLAASESVVLASRMGQVVMVVEAGKTTEAVLKDALSRIESRSLVGLMLNKGSAPGSGLHGGQGYDGYGYGYGEDA